MDARILQLVCDYPEAEITPALLERHLNYYIEDLHQEMYVKRNEYNKVAKDLWDAEKSMFNEIKDMKEWKSRYQSAQSSYIDVNVDIAYAEARLDTKASNVVRIAEDIEIASKNRVDAVNLRRKELQAVLESYKSNRDNMAKQVHLENQILDVILNEIIIFNYYYCICIQHKALDREIAHVRSSTLRTAMLCKRSQEVSQEFLLFCCYSFK